MKVRCKKKAKENKKKTRRVKMLHSKATAALMKLKEIDRKYKMKNNEEFITRQRPSLSDISAVDSIDEISSSVVVAPPGSGDSPKVIPRPKLDIRMPEAHMERAETRRVAAGVDVIEPPVELVTIFDKLEKNSPRFSQKGKSRGKVAEEQEVDSAGEGNDAVFTNPEISSSTRQGSSFNEKSGANTETSISEDVQEVVSSIPQTSLSKSSREIASLGEETSPKSVDSIINGDEDPSDSVTSNTYSDDFVKTVSQVGSLDGTSLSPSEKIEKSIIGPRANIVVDSAAEVREPRSSPRAKYVTGTSPVPQTTEFRAKEIVELVAPKIMPRVISECETNLDAALSDYVKMIEGRASGNEEFERIVDDSDRTLSRSSQAASARSTKKRRGRKGKPRAVSSRDSQASMSRELTSSLEHKTESTTPRDSKSQDLTGSRKAQELEELRNRNVDAQVPRNPKEEITKSITRRKIAPKVKTESTKNRMRTEAPWSAEPASSNLNDYGETQKSKPAIEPVPVTMVGLAPLGDNLYKLRISQRQKVSSKKLENEENVCSKHPIKRGGFDNRKNRTKKKSRSSKEEPDRPGRIGMKELRQREERYQLRARVRSYIQQMLDERERLLVPDGFGVPVEKRPCNHRARRLRQSESPPRYFFKPLDLPNVAAFKRPGKLVSAALE